MRFSNYGVKAFYNECWFDGYYSAGALSSVRNIKSASSLAHSNVGGLVPTILYRDKKVKSPVR